MPVDSVEPDTGWTKACIAMMPLIANSLWFASCLPEAAAFQHATRNVEATQRQVLRGILRGSLQCANIKCVTEFQERVPFCETPQETADPVIRWVPTSGTT